jgi:hypothetical protein
MDAPKAPHGAQVAPALMLVGAAMQMMAKSDKIAKSFFMLKRIK